MDFNEKLNNTIIPKKKKHKKLRKAIKSFAFLTLILGILYAMYIIIVDSRQNIYRPEINQLLFNRKIIPLEKQFTIEELQKLKLPYFYINTSHNTYLWGSQHLSLSVEGYNIKRALRMGARAIEIDIGGTDKPKVYHGTSKFSTTNQADLDEFLYAIKEEAFRDTSDPLILFIEIYGDYNNPKEARGNVKLLNKIRESILNILGPMLYKRSENNNILANEISMDKLLNKIVIYGTLSPNNTVLNDIFDCYPNGTTYLINLDHKDPEAITPQLISGNLYRIYPYPTPGSIISLNYNIKKYLLAKKNFIALNFQSNDKPLYDNIKFFQNSSYRLIYDQNTQKDINSL